MGSNVYVQGPISFFGGMACHATSPILSSDSRGGDVMQLDADDDAMWLFDGLQKRLDVWPGWFEKVLV